MTSPLILKAVAKGYVMPRNYDKHTDIQTDRQTQDPTSFPGSFLYAKTRRKHPGWSWSRVTRISRGKLELISGRVGRGACVSCSKLLRLKIHDLMRFCIVFALFLHCFCYKNTSKKSDMHTIAMTSSKSSIKLHVSYFKGHSSKPLQSRRWLKTRRWSIKIYLDRK